MAEPARIERDIGQKMIDLAEALIAENRRLRMAVAEARDTLELASKRHGFYADAIIERCNKALKREKLTENIS